MRSFTAVVNPISGGGLARARFEPLAQGLTQAGANVTVVETQDAEHAIEVSAAAAGTGDVVVAVGGDGIVRDVATGVVPAGGLMAIVPAGRGNDLAAFLNIPTDPLALVEMLLNGVEQPLDVLEAGGVIVPGNVYVGLDAMSTLLINAHRRIPAKLLYRIAPAVALLRWKPAQFTMRYPAGAVPGSAKESLSTVQAHMVVVANSGKYGHGLNIVPSADPGDGLLDVLTMGAVGKLKFPALMNDAQTGAHVSRPEVTVTQATEVLVDADRSIPVCADGDEIGTLPVTVKLLAGAMRLVLPNGSASPVRV